MFCKATEKTFFHFVNRSLTLIYRYAALAQSVEQRTENPCVRGSIPRGGTISFNKGSYISKVFKIDIEEKEFYWLVGLLEGEATFGSFIPPSKVNCYPYISVEMTDEDIIQKISKIFGNKYQKCKRKTKPKWKPTFVVKVRGFPAYSWMKLLYPHMGDRRKEQIEKIIEKYNPDTFKITWKNKRKLTDEIMEDSLKKLRKGESLRSVARAIGIHQESLRIRLKNMGYSSSGKDIRLST